MSKKKTQSERFIEKARELEADESGKEFERVFRKAVPPKRGLGESQADANANKNADNDDLP